jgi:hypothetical protein
VNAYQSSRARSRRLTNGTNVAHCVRVSLDQCNSTRANAGGFTLVGFFES